MKIIIKRKVLNKMEIIIQNENINQHENINQRGSNNILIFLSQEIFELKHQLQKTLLKQKE